MGYRVVKFEVNEKHRLYPYFEDCCKKAKNLYNVTNFNIRQVMTGIKKKPFERQENEVNVLNNIEQSLPQMNAIRTNGKGKKKNSTLFFNYFLKGGVLRWDTELLSLKLTKNIGYIRILRIAVKRLKTCIM